MRIVFSESFITDCTTLIHRNADVTLKKQKLERHLIVKNLGDRKCLSSPVLPA